MECPKCGTEICPECGEEITVEVTDNPEEKFWMEDLTYQQIRYILYGNDTVWDRELADIDLVP